MRVAWLIAGAGALLTFAMAAQAKDAAAIPHLEKRGRATQLIVGGNPFLVLGGEIHNSSATSRAYMANVWPRARDLNLNTILAAVPWAVVEPQEGRFDFTIVDQLIEDARTNGQHLILLWFGSWKNGLSHYPPAWAKRDTSRFPRVQTRTGTVENFTPLAEASVAADAKAFAALMAHIKAIDGSRQTVLMVQVENEVGLLGDARDRSAPAETAFARAVPAPLIAYLQAHRDTLRPEVRSAWASGGFRSAGSWPEVFGRGTAGEEIFMAWHYARYVDRVAAAGKREYSLPMFANAWILQPDDDGPGDYPTGGPQAHNLDIWRAGAPSLDILAPDIYLPDFTRVATEFTAGDAPFFVPESRNGADGAANALLAIGAFRGIGYSPFGIGPGDDNKANLLADTNAMLRELSPIILDCQAKGAIAAVAIDKANPSEAIVLGDYRLNAILPVDRRTGQSAERGQALILATAPDEFLIMGSDINITFATNLAADETVGLADVEEGRFVSGVWQAGRNLSGDEIMIRYDIAGQAAARQTGSGIKLPSGPPSLQRVRLYRFAHKGGPE